MVSVFCRSSWTVCGIRRTRTGDCGCGTTDQATRARPSCAPPPPATRASGCSRLSRGVSGAFGRLSAADSATVLYRHHGSNAIGARAAPRSGWSALPDVARRALRDAPRFRADLARAAAQAAAFLARYDSRLTPEDRRFLRAFADIPRRGMVSRKLDVLRLRVVPGAGVLRALGAALRA